MDKLIFKELSLKDATVKAEERIVEGYASTWDLDQVADVIHKGAFQKSLQERFPAGKIKVLRDHMDPIGKPIEMYEDDKGLFVRAYISPTPLGDETLQLAKDGVIDRFSIGFGIPHGKSEIDDNGVRHIYEAKLYEFSLVTFPANEAAVLTAVKSLRQKLQAGSMTAEDVALALDIKSEGEPQDTSGKPQDLDEVKHLLDEMANFARNRLY